MSRVGRLTLDQSILGSLPIFNMELERLSVWVHKGLDRVARRCVCRSGDGRKGLHLLSWETLNKPKRLRGANLKSTKEINWAMLEKLAWRVMNSDGEVWCDVLRFKYRVKEEDKADLRLKARSSQVWKGVVWGSELVRRGLKWSVGNDKRIVFWKDIWLGDKPLREELQTLIGAEELELKDEQYWDETPGWRWGNLVQKLSTMQMVRLGGVMLSTRSFGQGQLCMES